MQRPFYSVGLLYSRNGIRLDKFLGTTFAFRHTDYFITASHCVGAQTPSDLAIAMPAFSGTEGLAVKKLWKHPSADVAILNVSNGAKFGVEPFVLIDAATDYGESVAALGFPEESHPDDTLKPTVRYFRGSVQRLFDYEHKPWRYAAYELSFGAPAGLSGGPVFPTRDNTIACGVVAANHSATTYLSSVAEVQEGSNYHSERIHTLIEYGIAVRLDQHLEWLNSIIPA
jgi:hypothetical protein